MEVSLTHSAAWVRVLGMVWPSPTMIACASGSHARNIASSAARSGRRLLAETPMPSEPMFVAETPVRPAG